MSSLEHYEALHSELKDYQVRQHQRRKLRNDSEADEIRRRIDQLYRLIDEQNRFWAHSDPRAKAIADRYHKWTQEIIARTP